MAEKKGTRFKLDFGDAVGAGPDPIAHPEYYRGVAIKRILAYLVDVAVIGLLLGAAALVFAVLGIVTFGVLTPLLLAVFAAIPLSYHVLLIGGPRSATLGMRLFRLEVRSLTRDRPDYIQAAVQTVLFYLSVGFTSWLILVVALFNTRRRTLHDIIAGTVVVNRLGAEAAAPGPATAESGFSS